MHAALDQGFGVETDELLWEGKPTRPDRKQAEPLPDSRSRAPRKGGALICRSTRRPLRRWMAEFAQQHRRGKHVLLYGNIADQFLLNGEYMSLLDFLGRYLRGEGTS